MVVPKFYLFKIINYSNLFVYKDGGCYDMLISHLFATHNPVLYAYGRLWHRPVNSSLNKLLFWQCTACLSLHMPRLTQDWTNTQTDGQKNASKSIIFLLGGRSQKAEGSGYPTLCASFNNHWQSSASVARNIIGDKHLPRHGFPLDVSVVSITDDSFEVHTGFCKFSMFLSFSSLFEQRLKFPDVQEITRTDR